MTSPFGYDETIGWIPAPGPLVLTYVEDKYRVQTTANVDMLHGPAADLIRTLSAILVDVWADQQGAYDSGHISAAPGTGGVAQGSALEVLLSSRIGPKLIAVASTVVLPLLADVGPNVNVPAGHSVTILDEPGTWTLDAPVVIPGGGSIDGNWTYFETGPKLAIAATTWAITTPVTGWASVGPGPADAIPGRDVETDAEYRRRYSDALLSDALAELGKLEGVSSVSFVEHPHGYPDAFWGLTHWVEYLMVGGDNVEIATVINKVRAKGVHSVGNVAQVISVDGYIGGTVSESFSRAALIQSFADVTITKGAAYPSDNSAAAILARKDAIKGAVVGYFAGLVAGQTAGAYGVEVAIGLNSGIPGLLNVVVLLGLSAPPLLTSITAEVREQLTIDVADIGVTGA